MARTPRRLRVQIDKSNEVLGEKFEAAYEASGTVVRYEDGFWLVVGMDQHFGADGRSWTFTLLETNPPKPK